MGKQTSTKSFSCVDVAAHSVTTLARERLARLVWRLAPLTQALPGLADLQVFEEN